MKTNAITVIGVAALLGVLVTMLVHQSSSKPSTPVQPSFSVITTDNGTNTSVYHDVKGYIQVTSKGVSIVNPSTGYRVNLTNALITIQP